MSNCLNCQQPLAGPYCHHCGQVANTRRFTFGHLASEVLASLTNVERGLWHTIRDLTLRPATALRGYLAGQRVVYYPWLRYLLLMVGLATLVTLSTKGFQDLYQAAFKDNGQKLAQTEVAVANRITTQKATEKFQAFLLGNYNLVYLLFLPFAALSFHWLFRRRGLYLAEHLVVQAYTFGHYSLFHAVLFVVLKLLEGQAWYGAAFWALFGLSALFQLVYNLVVYVGLFPVRPWAAAARGLVAFGLAYLIYSLMIAFAQGLYIGFVLTRG